MGDWTIRNESLLLLVKLTFSIWLRHVSISSIVKVFVESNDALEFVIELMYSERASAITLEFVELLRNMLTDASYTENIQKTKDLSILCYT